MVCLWNQSVIPLCRSHNKQKLRIAYVRRISRSAPKCWSVLWLGSRSPEGGKQYMRIHGLLLRVRGGVAALGNATPPAIHTHLPSLSLPHTASSVIRLKMHRGSCLCKGITFEVIGDPETCIQCYCEHCQKNAGGPYQVVGACITGVFSLVSVADATDSVQNSVTARSSY